MALDLISVSSATQLADAIHSPLSLPVKRAIASTVLSLASIQRAFDADSSLSTFFPDHLVLLPPKAQGVQTPPEHRLVYLRDLTVLANSAAEALSCSSILAGQGSESDDTGDVALWLGNGDYGPGYESKVLDLFELTPWLNEGASISRVTLAHPSFLPPTVPKAMAIPEGQRLVGKMNEMAEKYCFQISSPSTAPLVLFFYLGRFERGGWGGLFSIGTWSD